jgi:sulfate transport system ATP-binding protein
MSIAVSHISKRFETRGQRAVPALRDVSLEVQRGELLAMLGPSGSGKTTLLRIIAGLEIPDAGQVTFVNEDVTEKSAYERKAGFVFQAYALFQHMNVFENIAFGLRVLPRKKRPGAEAITKRVTELLQLIQLEGYEKRLPSQLSGGQRQRVALARALAIEPRVLLLDEPLSALDAKVRAELRDQIRALQQRLAITTVFVTHDQEEAMSMADRVCVMFQGRVEQVATPSVLYSQPATPFVGRFVGVSSRVAVTRRGDHVEVLGRDVPIRGDLAAVPAGELEALLRPEDLDVTVNPNGLGVVTHRSFLGATTRVGVGIAGANLRVDVRSAQADDLELGTRVDVSVNARDVLVTTRQPSS